MALTDLLQTEFTASVSPAKGPGAALISTTVLLHASRVPLLRQLSTRYTLTTDSPVPVDFGALSAAHVLGLALDAETTDLVRVQVTWGSGQTPEELPLEDFLWLQNRGTPITAVSLVRTAGKETTVEVFLGQRADA